MMARRGAFPVLRRGGLLLEVVLALALFGGAAAFTLAAVRSVFTTLDHTRRRQEAIDLARSRLAGLEAGLISVADLRAGTMSGDPGEIRRPGWTFDLKTQRTEFTGLTLVELTVREQVSGLNRDTPITYALRQLMPLRENSAQAFERE